MTTLDPHAIYRAIESDVIAVPASSKAEVLELLQSFGTDDEGLWTDVEVTAVLDKMLSFQQKVIQIVRIVAPEDIKTRELDASREVWLTIFRVKKVVQGMLKDRAA